MTVVSSHKMSDLISLGEKLASKGPHKTEDTPRRVRGLLGGKYIFDTLQAKYVWEHPYYPYFYILVDAFSKDVQFEKIVSKKSFHIAKLSSGHKSTNRVIVFETSHGELSNLVRIEHSALDAWFVEDEKLLGPHPKDPYKRIETIPSSREIRIELEGVVIAKSTQNVFLFETMLRTRFYLDPTMVDWSVLRESETITYCPYKGMANYYHVDFGGKTIEDAVWYYKDTRRFPECLSEDIPGTEIATIDSFRDCFYRAMYRLLVAGAVLARTYLEPLFQAREEGGNEAFFGRMGIDDYHYKYWDITEQIDPSEDGPPRPEDIAYMRRFPVYNYDITDWSEIGVWRNQWYEKCLWTFASWIVDDGRERQRKEDPNRTVPDWALKPEDVGAVRELMLLLVAYDHFHSKFSNLTWAGRGMSDYVKKQGNRSVSIVRFGIFQLEKVTMPADFNDLRTGEKRFRISLMFGQTP
ncbi:hypothetical protein IFR04_008858 [Cadophora malorum]|uniref:DUF427 domain-containing protein n=1 Tax=Cadophora malorum TaxID=108018 RepID=A0A8H7TFU5_9HELO|nr:hypothetical protein IFR04_008858 [Cadophora malorum]